jgi:hypothetical protein
MHAATQHQHLPIYSRCWCLWVWPSLKLLTAFQRTSALPRPACGLVAALTELTVDPFDCKMSLTNTHPVCHRLFPPFSCPAVRSSGWRC